MTSREPGPAPRTREMEEKEQLRRQIRLLQGLIDDYKNHHGNVPAPGTSAASRWQPSSYHSGRAFGARYPRSSRRGFSSHNGPSWRKKYSLVNRPPRTSDTAGDRPMTAPLGAGGSQGPNPQQYVFERQVQLNPDQNMIIKIKPPSKSSSMGAPGAQRGFLEEYCDPSWSDQRPQVGEGEPPGGQLPTSRPGRARGSYSAEEPLLVCQKEPGKSRVVKSVGSRSGSPPEPRRTVSESEIAVKGHLPSSTLAHRAAPAAASGCAMHPFDERNENSGLPDEPAPSGSVVALTRPVSGTKQGREASLLVSCRSNKFRKNNYKWVAASAKSPRATRRSLSPRTTVESVNRAPCGAAGKAEKPQAKADPEARSRKLAVSSKPGAPHSKYKWKASSPSAAAAASCWQPEVGSKDHTSRLSPVPSRSPSEDRSAVGSSSLKPVFGDPSAYKVKSRTKLIRRRGSASLPGDKKNSPSLATTTRSHFNLRRRQVLRGKNSPVLKKTPNKGLLQVTKHRLCRLPQSRSHLSAKEASSMHLRTPPTSKVIKTRYRIVKKTSASPLSIPPFPLTLPSWRARRTSLSRSLVLNRLRPANSGGGKLPCGSPRWRSKGYRCIGGVLYKVSANKLSKTSSRPGDSSRSLLRTGRGEAASSCGRSLASRAVQRSLAIIRQAKQKKKKREYCMYYNRFGRCNRGELCPYIHDPEKVAVCTRFLRGTCKKTDGTCPFSHHVSKEKMPVCSYFLKGICNNSNCPYSHVYVSRKAEVCKDFLKGYCPLGTKCKKKHTLLCPDFARSGACPHGAQCQLLHRNPKRPSRRAAAPPTPAHSEGVSRSRASSGHGSRKSSATQRPARQTPSSPASRALTPASRAAASASASLLSSKATAASSPSSPSSSSPSLSLDQEEPGLPEEEASAVGGLCRLPSFISLQSSPSPGGPSRAPTPRTPVTKDSGRPLHIKPRL
ncbi:LOW QUALITY PROTEIN: zinc finger CCCH domain-containing protein 3 [Perognathus longimembris pacificus]|uniref:LOW QUALITY PROTEIN: zinc finger CCCH domain-containing protein 3 n=1 Tax=Perognathus longimembris pacificus TaxID=214514 RepID=UPI00201966B2|nr:LOW QUALITY PROTEIN: zinc finger CCCH domain-containing protein 3 [Perognathus longimembris pacificus]